MTVSVFSCEKLQQPEEKHTHGNGISPAGREYTNVTTDGNGIFSAGREYTNVTTDGNGIFPAGKERLNVIGMEVGFSLRGGNGLV